MNPIEQEGEAKEVFLNTDGHAISQNPVDEGPEYDIDGNIMYKINFKGGNFTTRYQIDNQNQLIGMMITRDSFGHILEADAKRPKDHPNKMKWQEKQRLTGAIHQINRYTSELAGYVLGKHKDALKNEGVVKKLGLTDVNGNPLK